MKKWLKYFISFLFILGVILVTFAYFGLQEAGKQTFKMRSNQMNILVENYPDFFRTIYNNVFPFALACDQESEECIRLTRSKFDQLTTNVKTNMLAVEQMKTFDEGRHLMNPSPSNSQPMYFIQLLSDKKIAKLFFSGELKIEEVDNREERMVREVLEGKRKELYGPYFNSEAFISGADTSHPYYDFKPAYLKDLYAQMEVIIPYYQDGKVVGAIVYLHGE